MSAILTAEQAQAARPYDFAQPERLTPRLREQLQAQLEEHGHFVAADLGRFLDMPLELEFQDATESSANRFHGSEAEPLFQLPPIAEGGQVLCRFDVTLSQACVDRLLGGVGQPRDVERPPTAIEVALLELVAQRLDAAWRSRVPEAAAGVGAARHVPVESRSELPETEGIAARFAVRLGEAQASLAWFAGYADLARLTGLALAPTAATRDAGAAEPLGPNDIEGLRIPVRVRLPAMPVRVRDAIGLRVGDVLQLDRGIHDEVEVQVGDRVAFRGRAGTVGSHVGVEITRAL